MSTYSSRRQTPFTPSSNKKPWKSVIKLFTMLALVGVSVLIGYAIANSQQAHTTVSVPVRIAQAVHISQKADPTVITVTSEDDRKKLEQNFAGTVQVGDQLYVYEEAKRTVLFRPSLSKIILVSPLK